MPVKDVGPESNASTAIKNHRDRNASCSSDKKESVETREAKRAKVASAGEESNSAAGEEPNVFALFASQLLGKFWRKKWPTSLLSG